MLKFMSIRKDAYDEYFRLKFARGPKETLKISSKQRHFVSMSRPGEFVLEELAHDNI